MHYTVKHFLLLKLHYSSIVDMKDLMNAITGSWKSPFCLETHTHTHFHKHPHVHQIMRYHLSSDECWSFIFICSPRKYVNVLTGWRRSSCCELKGTMRWMLFALCTIFLIFSLQLCKHPTLQNTVQLIVVFCRHLLTFEHFLWICHWLRDKKTTVFLLLSSRNLKYSTANGMVSGSN